MNIDDIQIGGSHYKNQKTQHWNAMIVLNADYFSGVITKYVVRYKNKNGLEDLYKARHYLDKYATTDISIFKALIYMLIRHNRIYSRHQTRYLNNWVEEIRPQNNLGSLVVYSVMRGNLAKAKWDLDTLIRNEEENNATEPNSAYTNQG